MSTEIFTSQEFVKEHTEKTRVAQATFAANVLSHFTHKDTRPIEKAFKLPLTRPLNG